MAFTRYKVLPGISYIPEKWEFEMDPKLQAKLVHQFIDFLHCVTDLLKLVKVIKAKFLRSRTPMPVPVITEVLNTSSREKMKVFERSLLENNVPVGPLLDLILRGGGSSSQSKNFSRTNSMWAQRNPAANTPMKASVKTVRNKEYSARVYKDLAKIIGKKAEPIWHTVAAQWSDDDSGPGMFVSKTDVSVRPQAKSKVSEVEVSKTYEGLYSDQHISNIMKNSSKRRHATLDEELYATLQNTQGEKHYGERYQAQVDMIEAYFAGFDSVEEHKDHLEHMSPHWFKDLLQSAMQNHVYITLEVKKAFVKLSEFYNWSDVYLARAKLCFVMQSLPVWAICRNTMQEAAEFVLKEIFGVDDPHTDLVAWLEERDLPYVVLPPTVSQEVNPIMSVPNKLKSSKSKQKQQKPDHDHGNSRFSVAFPDAPARHDSTTTLN